MEGVNSSRRGRTYAADGSVLTLATNGTDTISAEVQGSQSYPYMVTLKLKSGVGSGLCTCPMYSDCKHVYAVVLRLLGEFYWRGPAGDSSDEIGPLLPAGWRASHSALPRCNISKEVEQLFSGSPKHEEASKSAVTKSAKPAEPQKALRIPPAPKLPWWRLFLEATDEKQRRNLLVQAAQDRMPQLKYSWFAGDAIAPLVNTPHPLVALARLEDTIARYANRAGYRYAPRDPELQEFLQSDEASAALAEIRRAEVENTLIGWLESSSRHQTQGAQAKVDVVWLYPQSRLGVPTLCFQLLLTTPKAVRKPRSSSSLSTLYGEIRRGTRSLPPGEAAFVDWLANHRAEARSYELREIVPEADNITGVLDPILWLSKWGHLGVIQWEDGAPCALGLQSARLTVAGGDGDPEWAVAFPPENGQGPLSIPLREAGIFIEHPDYSDMSREAQLYVRRGNSLCRVESGGMPIQVFAAILKMKSLPIERLRKSRAGAELAKRMYCPELQIGEPGLIQQIPVRPNVELRLDDQNRVEMKIVAQADGGAQFTRGLYESWTEILSPSKPVPLPASVEQQVEALEEIAFAEQPGGASAGDEPLPAPEQSPHALARVPRESDIGGLDQWLRLFVPVSARELSLPGAPPIIEWKVNKQEFLHMLEAWGGRPRGVTFLGNKSFENLVRRRTPPKFKLKAEASGVDWLRVSVEFEDELEQLSLQDVVAALAASQEDLVVLRGGRAYTRQALEEYRRQVEALTEIGIELAPGEQRLHAAQLGGGRNTEVLASLEDDGQLRDLAAKSRHILRSFTGVPSAKVDDFTAAFLRPYQVTGADFLAWASKTFGGALLADDMGLGKTLQVLAALTALGAGNGKKKAPSLVVCPASVAHNWQREAARFAPHLRVQVIERGGERKEILERLTDYDLIVTNYALARREAEALSSQEWLAAVVDEAQAIKNPDAEIARTVKSVSAQFRIALTGTPIENRLTDLWSIMDFAAPGYLGTLPRFQQRLNDAGGSAHKLMRAKLRPVLMRRMKSEVAPELPERIEERIDCEMADGQRTAYLAEVKKTRMLLDGIAGADVKGAGRIQMLAALVRLRQICCDPALVGLTDRGSGKVDELMRILPPILEAGHKVLLFSQFVKMLNLLKPQLEREGVPTRMLTGQTVKRQKLVDEFEQDPKPGVFLISLKAGGTGLNLTAASHVILFDPWWNPAVEAQAIDRTHRIGQDKTVIAFRLVTEGTIEERILELQEQKRALVRNVLEEEAFNRTLTRQDFEFLLRGE